MSVAQLTGIVVTSIIVFGTDMDTIYAMPLGIMAGALAMFFTALADYKQQASVKVRK